MIAASLRAEIDRYSRDARHSNALFCRAQEGALSAAHLRRYLINIHFLLLHTPPNLAKARERAVDLADQPLAAHFAHKLQEETGHDEWAKEDIAKISARAPIAKSQNIAPTMVDLVGFVARIIEEDPALYLSYILFVEQLSVALGPEWLRLLEERCGIPQTCMTVIGKHAELDREHVEEALDIIDDLVADPAKLPRMRETLLVTIAHFDRFCDEITQDLPLESDDAPVQSSAA